ncbi:alpha/beta fold hydrolase [Rhodoblastus sp.]|jgi:predicted alpha/beta hydrolase|uniref:alpha/beta hydrolase family protein n=1 Tax=Rhodoblastus sp. TaxID=1962975 RepID=UPI0025EB36F9|nr:alpha/beta fold hydrolase [Rhodoblastus sp.]
MTIHPQSASVSQQTEIVLACRDGVALRGHFWPCGSVRRNGVVVINPTFGAPARTYHRYAAFLARHGFDVLTYDYRGVGLSRPDKLRGCRYRLREWGLYDCDAALAFSQRISPGARLIVIGHGFGGCLPGLAPNGLHISRILTMGTLYGSWGDYPRDQRRRLFWQWHVAMPALTARYGYFPGKRVGLSEDLPKGVANAWSFRRRDIELNHPSRMRPSVRAGFSSVIAPILAIVMSDDEFGVISAANNALRYYTDAERQSILLDPQDFGCEKIGHFGMFETPREADLWQKTLGWLRDGANPWSERRFR